MARFNLLWFCSSRALKKRGPHSSGRLSRFSLPCELGEQTIRADLTPAVPCGDTVVSSVTFCGTEMEENLHCQPGRRLFSRQLRYNFKLHFKTAPDPAFLNPALCLYPHWQPQRIITTGWATTSRPDSLQERHRWCLQTALGMWTAFWEYSRLLDGPGTGTDAL